MFNLDIYKVLHMIKLNDSIELVESKWNRVVSADDLLAELKDKRVDFSCPNSIVSSLSDEFVSKLPVIIQKITFEGTLIPSDVPVFIEKKKYRVMGEVWIIHKNDADPFPSSPHAHNYEQNLVMHLGNGRMFRKRSYVATANKKQFMAVRQQINNIKLPPLEI